MPINAGTTRVSIVRLMGAISLMSWTVADQALLGLANFGAALVLARWFTQVEYGGYTLATAVFWMATPLHYGFLSEPIMVFGSGQFRDRLSSYFTVLLMFHCCLSGVMAIGVAAAGLLFTSRASMTCGASLLGYALATPFILLLPLIRAILYVRSAPRLSAGASGVYLLGMLAIMYLLYHSATLSAFTAPLVAAGASTLAIAGIIGSQRFELWSLRQNADFVRRIACAHWRYGRWAVVTTALEGFSSSFYYLIVPFFVGLEGNAALRALIILILPAIQANVAFVFLLVPALTRARQRRDGRSLVWKALIVLVAGACLYALLIAEFGPHLMEVFYHGRYAEYVHFAWLVGLIPIPVAAVAALGSDLRARERPDRVLWAHVISTAVTCVIGSIAIAIWGLLGALLGILGGYITTMVVMLWWTVSAKCSA